MEAGLIETNQVRNLTITELVANKNIVLGAIKESMDLGKDYGTIPGCGDKPALFKPGAEKLLMMFKLCAEPHVQNLSTQDETHYMVTTKIIHAPSGTVVGYGIGEASSDEEKYRWRKASCQEEYDETHDDRRRGKWVPKWNKGQKVYKDGKVVMEKLLQVRTNHADLANTILKMADKRSFVGATLKVTAASSVFTQDLEDLSDELREVVVETEGEAAGPAENPIQQPQRASEAAPTAKEEVGQTKPSTLTDASKPIPDKKWKKMESKKAGKCAKCQQAIAVGVSIYWDAEEFSAYHSDHFA